MNDFLYQPDITIIPSIKNINTYFLFTILKLFLCAICIVHLCVIIKRRTIPCCDLRLDWFVKTSHVEACFEIPFQIRSTRKAQAQFITVISSCLSACLPERHTLYLILHKSHGGFSIFTQHRWFFWKIAKFISILFGLVQRLFPAVTPQWSRCTQPWQINLTYAFRSVT